MKLLRIDSSARQSSVSRQLTGAFVKAWKRQCPDGEVVSRDLTDLAIPAISDEWEAAARTDPTNRTPAHRVVLALSDRLVDELEAANVIVIGSPMHDFTVSAHLKAWIDQIVRPGRTVAYGPQGPQGLLTGRRVVVLTSRGGSYSENPLRLKLDFQAPYLQAILAFIGMTDITFHSCREPAARPAQADLCCDEAIVRINEFVLMTTWLPDSEPGVQ